jgi:hypothetical protein
MSTDRETTRIVRSWLEEGRTTLPDWVRDDVFDRLPATPQRRSRGTAWRFLTMPTAAKTAIAAAAVILVAVGALAFLQRPSGPGATPTPSPTTAPTPTLTAEPSESVTQLPKSGPISAGTYRMGSDASIVLTIPSGWDASFNGSGIKKHPDQDGELSLWVTASDISVYPDICATAVEPATVSPTGDDLLARLRAQKNSVVSDPVNVTVGGREVMRIELSAAEGLDWAGCTEGFVKFWRSGDIYSALSSPGTSTFYLVQTPAGPLVFDWGHSPDASAADVAELDAMVESMVIEP